jgi:hypothetical protein
MRSRQDHLETARRNLWACPRHAVRHAASVTALVTLSKRNGFTKRNGRTKHNDA